MSNIDLNVIWRALHSYREDLISEGQPEYDDEWSDICYQMALIAEQLEATQ